MSAEQAIQAWIVYTDMFVCDAWPWLAVLFVMFAVTAWILIKRR